MATGFDPGVQHPLYKKWLSKWLRQRHTIEGEDRIKQDDVDTRYLPRLDGQPTDALEARTNPDNVVTSYESYKNRASYMNAVGRTREGLVGAIMRKDPDLQWPKDAVDELDIVGVSLESFDELIDDTLNETVGVGRYGQLVDMPRFEDKPDPFVAPYHAEAITDWELGAVKGRKWTVRVNLLESSGFMHKSEGRELEKYRVLRLGVPMPETDEEEKMGQEEFLALWGLMLADFAEGPVYFQEIWMEVEKTQGKNSDGKEFQRVEIIVPRSVGGVLWREIPFTFFGAEHTRPKPTKPPLLDLAVLNLSHYRNSADLEHGLHFTALPQPWAAGFNFKGNLFIGSGVAWVSEDPNATAGYLEFSGEGLAAIERAMERKGKQMAAIGARVLEEQSPAGGAEAAETVKLRQSGEKSVLARIAITASEGLTRTLRFLRRFKGQTDDSVLVQLNTDFGVEGLPPEMLTALMQQVQGGLMSWDTYVFNVRRGELYPDGWTQEEEAAAIQAGPPKSPTTLLDPKREDEPGGEADEDEEDEETEDQKEGE